MSVKKIKHNFFMKHFSKYKTMTKKEQKEFDPPLNDKLSYKINKQILEFIGNKESDYFTFYEIGFNDKNSKKLKTLYELSEYNRKYQRKYSKSIENEEGILYLKGDWARYIDKQDKRMYYIDMYSVHWYLFDKIYYFLEEYLNKKVPNLFYMKYDKDILKKEKDTKYYTMNESEIRANGKETEYNFLHKYLMKDLSLSILTDCIKYSKYYLNCTFIEKTNKYNKNIIISSLELTKDIKMNSIISDIHSYEQPFQIIKNDLKFLKKKYKKIFKKIIKEQNIMNTFTIEGFIKNNKKSIDDKEK